ncbi:hypothetical protein EDD18DRAFT_1100997 [Armillaria luteobubalina]|uniref:Uncharacterized protein n=1 Tax=Armillaria luteobubalina TaxID=153913 RepID=A0AA39QGS2_9AGAR|nr:hypothetical protein EDD18DRAFT_1100997 [Armillaria luteobubalina]
MLPLRGHHLSISPAAPYSVYEISLVLKAPWLQHDLHDDWPYGVPEASLHFIPFFISTCMKDKVVTVVDKSVMEVVKEEVDIPVDAALADESEEYTVMIDNSAVKTVKEEVDIPVDVALADEPDGY